MAGIKGAIAVLVDTITADAAVNQYQAVVQSTADYHGTNPAGPNAAEFLGITLDSALAGDSCPIVRLGTAWCQAAGAIAAGDFVSIANATGQVQAGGSNVIGIAVSTTTTANDIVLVYIAPTPGVNALKAITGTTNATAATQTAYPHGLGYAPKTVLVTPQGNAAIWESQAADATNIYLSASAAAIAFAAYVG